MLTADGALSGCQGKTLSRAGENHLRFASDNFALPIQPGLARFLLRHEPKEAVMKRKIRRDGANKQRWSAQVTQRSDALDLESGVFKRNPHDVAVSLKRSAEQSTRRKSSPYRSAMSMLTFYINRAGSHLSTSRSDVLERAKDELRKLFSHD